MTKSNPERLERLDTQMEEVLKRLDNIQQKLEEQERKYVTSEEFAAFRAMAWLTHTFTALGTAVVTGLVAFFLGHR